MGLVWLVSPARAHLHLEIVFERGQLRLLLLDLDSGEVLPADEEISVGVAAARPVPAHAAFVDLLGEAGSTTWILPEVEHPELPWLGIGSLGLSSATFAGNLQLHLVGVDGPGDFAFFFTDPLGRPQPVMNSRDGVSESDRLSVPPASHIHGNWAFSAPGRYRLTFWASGFLRKGNVPVASAATDFFLVVIPPSPPRLALTRAGMNTLQLTLEGHPGLNYTLEGSTNFIEWSALTNLHAATAQTTPLLLPGPDGYQMLRARLR